MQNKGLLIIVVLVIILAGGYFLFGAKTKTSPTPNPARQEAPSAEVEETTGITEIQVEGNEFSFKPASISLKAGEKVRLTFTNAGKFPHNFTIDELGVASDTISAGETTIVEFSSTESGKFSFYCSVGNHRAQGMEGKVNVE